MTVWALTALLVAVGRQGRYGEALGHARRAAALAADSHDTRSLPLQPKLFLGLALFDCDLVDEARAAYREALDDEFDSGWWLSDTLMADAQASFAIGEWEDAVPRLIAGGQAAQEKDNPLLRPSRSPTGRSSRRPRAIYRAAKSSPRGIAGSSAGDRPSYNAGLLAFAVAGLKAAEGDQQGAYEVLLRCWRFDAATENRYYHRYLAPDLVRLALALGHRDVAADVTAAVAAGVALAPEVPTVRSLALRCQGLVDGELEPMIEAVALARRAPLLRRARRRLRGRGDGCWPSGRRDEAAALLAEALERYEQAGADAWAGRVRARLRASASVPGHAGRGTGRRSAGRASPRPSGRCRCWWPRG